MTLEELVRFAVLGLEHEDIYDRDLEAEDLGRSLRAALAVVTQVEREADDGNVEPNSDLGEALAAFRSTERKDPLWYVDGTHPNAIYARVAPKR